MNIDEEIKVVEKNIKESYTKTLADDVPDLWGRIEAGYEKELETMNKNSKNKTSVEKKKIGKVDMSAYESRVDRDRIYDGIPNSEPITERVDNGVDQSEPKTERIDNGNFVQEPQTERIDATTTEKVVSRKNLNKNSNIREFKKKKISRGWFGLVAAIILVCVIAIPVVKSGLIGGNKSDDSNMISHEPGDKKDDSLAENMEASAEMEQEEAGGVDATESAENTQATDTTQKEEAEEYTQAEGDVGNQNIAVGLDSTVDAEAGMENFEQSIELSGVIEYKNDKYTLIVNKVLTEQNDAEIAPGTEILLKGGTEELEIKKGESCKYGSVVVDNLQVHGEGYIANLVSAEK